MGTARTPAAVAQPDAAGYTDRVLDDSPQAAQEDEPEARDTGWPRGWSIEGQSTQQSGVVRQTSQSLLFSGYLDTPTTAPFRPTLNLNRDTAPVNGLGLVGSTGTPYSVVPYSYRTGSTWRIDQRGMPFDGGWFGNNSIGNINMASDAAGARRRPRLPAQPADRGRGRQPGAAGQHQLQCLGRPARLLRRPLLPGLLDRPRHRRRAPAPRRS